MKRFIENYTDKTYDLIIIGGGITGASVAYEAASRGLSVALFEKSDFGSETSAATSKMIHGGLRYLSTYDFGLVRESLRERRILTNIAPNLIHPTAFVFASYKRDKVSNSKMKLGMVLYQLFSFDRNWLWDKSKKMPGFKSLSKEEMIAKFPNALSQGLDGGQMFYDCISHSPERLTLTFVKSAVKYGADVSNYCEVNDFDIETIATEKIVKGVYVTDKTTNKKHLVKGKLVINCSGPWADILLDKVKKVEVNQELRRSEGIHFITKQKIGNHIYSGSTKTGRHFFLVPYRNHTLVGTTDKEFIGNPDKYKVTKAAILGLINEVNESFGNKVKLKYEDVIHAYGGLRPLVEDQTESSYKSSRKYEITGEKKNGIEGLITVEGGKFTTSRSLAEKAIDKAISILGYDESKSISKKAPLVGCEIKNYANFVAEKQKQHTDFSPSQIEYLVRSYGTKMDEIMNLTTLENLSTEPLNSEGELVAQVIYAIRNEMALSLADIVLRRTTIGHLGHPGKEILNKICEIAAQELNWDSVKKAHEIAKVDELLQLPK